MELEPRTTAPAHATGAVAFVPLAAVAGDVTFRLREEGDVAALAASIGRLGQLAPIELRPLPGASSDGRPRYQVVAGFRRLAALRLLMRERVLARVHERLSDEDAWGLALSQALLAEPLDRAALGELRERVAAAGIAAWADDLWDDALVRAPVEPELRERFFEYLGGGPAAEEAPAEDAAPHPEALETAMAPFRHEERAFEVEEAEPEEETVAEPVVEDELEVEVEVTPEELVADLAGRLYQVNADLTVAAEAWTDLPAAGRLAILDQLRWIRELLPHLEGDDER